MDAKDTRSSGKSTPKNKGVAGPSVHAPMGALKTESTTDVSAFVKRDQELGISSTTKRVSNEVRKA